MVEAADVARVVAKLAGIPEERLLMNDSARLLRLEEDLGARVIGHEDAIDAGGQGHPAQLRRLRQPPARWARFLFLGPTGVGKTELARGAGGGALRQPDALVRLDMSEMSEQFCHRFMSEMGILTPPVDVYWITAVNGPSSNHKSELGLPPPKFPVGIDWKGELRRARRRLYPVTVAVYLGYGLIVLFLAFRSASAWWQPIAWFAAGAAAWTWVEYLVHRSSSTGVFRRVPVCEK